MFFVVYLGEETIEKEQHISLLYTLLSVLKVEGQYVYPEGNNAASALSTAIGAIRNYVMSDGTICGTSTDTDLTKEDMNRFWEVVLRLCISADENDRQTVVNMAAFLTINMFRSFKKDIKTLGPHMINNVSKSFLSLFKVEIGAKFPPPSLRYCDLFSDHFPQSSMSARNFMAYTVKSWVLSQQNKEAIHDSVRGVLKAGCILALAENGLGAISWTLKAAKVLKVSVSTYLIHCMMSPAMERQVTRIAEILRDHNRGFTWPFCRLFDESALCDLSNDHCPEMSMIGALIGMGDYTKAQELQQFSKLKSLFPSMIKHANALKAILSPDIPDSASSKEGLRVLQYMQRTEILEGTGRIPRITASMGEKNLTAHINISGSTTSNLLSKWTRICS